MIFDPLARCDSRFNRLGLSILPPNRARQIALSLFGVAALSACTTVPVQPQRPVGPPPGQTPVGPVQPSQPGPVRPDPRPNPNPDVEEPSVFIPDDARPYFNDREGLTLPHMEGRDTKRLALLLPFSASNSRLRDEADSMFKAAELALFDRDSADVVLMALDTKGTEEGARSAARAAMAQGADVILGPVIASNVEAAASVVRQNNIPLLAFSNNERVAGGQTYLLSFPPEAEVERVVGYAAAQGIKRFAFFGPDNAYGRRVKAAYDRAVQATGGVVSATETYRGNDISVMQEPAQRLANVYRSAEREARRTRGVSPRAFEAILLPEGGTALRSLAPLLPFYGIDPADILVMGTSLWDDQNAAREPALNGGIFAASDNLQHDAFSSAYERAYGDDLKSLTTLAYDAVTFGTYIADGDPRGKRYRAENPSGFYGVDGFVRFGPDGRPERGLAVYTIRGGDITTLDPAPQGPPPDS